MSERTEKEKEANRKAVSKYQRKCINKSLKFSAPEIDFYNRIMRYCELSGEPFSTYIKRLIREDLEGKNM